MDPVNLTPYEAYNILFSEEGYNFVLGEQAFYNGYTDTAINDCTRNLFKFEGSRDIPSDFDAPLGFIDSIKSFAKYIFEFVVSLIKCKEWGEFPKISEVGWKHTKMFKSVNYTKLNMRLPFRIREINPVIFLALQGIYKNYDWMSKPVYNNIIQRYNEQLEALPNEFRAYNDFFLEFTIIDGGSESHLNERKVSLGARYSKSVYSFDEGCFEECIFI